MSTVEASTEVNAPIETVYNQWTQFEDFPRFMEGVKEVRQINDTELQWRAEIAGKEREWRAKILRQGGRGAREDPRAGAEPPHRLDEPRRRQERRRRDVRGDRARQDAH